MAVNTEFTVIKGKALDFAIIIKENGTTMPLELVAGDTFTFSIVEKKTHTKLIIDKAMTISNGLNGEVSGHLDATETNTLPLQESGGDDWYMSRPNLRMVISGLTANQGYMTAIIEDIYVIVG